jgi:hypothetical protein
LRQRRLFGFSACIAVLVVDANGIVNYTTPAEVDQANIA